MSLFKKKDMSHEEETEFNRLKLLKETIQSDHRLGKITDDQYRKLCAELVRQSYYLEEKYD